MKRDLLLILVITLLSSWTWVIFSINIFVYLALFLLSFLTFIFLAGHHLLLPPKILKVIFLVALIFISAYSMLVSFDRQLFSTSKLQSVQIKDRKEFYASELGSLYRNKYGIYYFDKVRPSVNKYINNIAALVDINGLFLIGFGENQLQTRFPIFFLPFMVIGLFIFLSKINKQAILIISFIFLTTGFLNTENSLGPLLIYPIVVSSIGMGFIKLFNLRL